MARAPAKNGGAPSSLRRAGQRRKLGHAERKPRPFPSVFTLPCGPMQPGEKAQDSKKPPRGLARAGVLLVSRRGSR